MSETARQFVGDIPKNYDERLGPNLFEDYAEDLAGRAAELRPKRVLELACGTGIVSRKLRDKLPKEARLVVTDLNPPMLDVARAKFGNDEVEFAQADAMKLDYPDKNFDLVVCQFGVMFFPEKRASFKEALRVLSPGGCYLLNSWGTHEENPCSRIANDAVLKHYPVDPPGFYKVPFSYADPDIAIGDLKVAGFARVEHFPASFTKKVKDMASFARGLVYGNPLAEEIRVRKGDPEILVRKIEGDLRAAFPDGAMPLKAHVYVAQRAR